LFYPLNYGNDDSERINPLNGVGKDVDALAALMLPVAIEAATQCDNDSEHVSKADAGAKPMSHENA
jgi:hypothetical protein